MPLFEREEIVAKRRVLPTYSTFDVTGPCLHLFTSMSLGMEGAGSAVRIFSSGVEILHPLGSSQIDSPACSSVAEVEQLIQHASVDCHVSVTCFPSNHLVRIYMGLSVPRLKSQGAFTM